MKIRNIFIFVFPFFLLNVSFACAADSSSNTVKIKQVPSVQLSIKDQNVIKGRISNLKSDMDRLDNRLDEMMKMSPAERKNSWKDLQASIEQVKRGSLELKKNRSILKGKKLEKSDWAPAFDELKETKAKLNMIARKFELLSKKQADALKEDVKSKRSEVESKFKAGEQQLNSDYNTLIGIVKTLNEEMGVFNKAIM